MCQPFFQNLPRIPLLLSTLTSTNWTKPLPALGSLPWTPHWSLCSSPLCPHSVCSQHSSQSDPVVTAIFKVLWRLSISPEVKSQSLTMTYRAKNELCPTSDLISYYCPLVDKLYPHHPYSSSSTPLGLLLPQGFQTCYPFSESLFPQISINLNS